MNPLNIETKEAYTNYTELTKMIGEKKQLKSFLSEYSRIIESFVQSRFLQVCWVNSDDEIHEFIEELTKSVYMI
jgi:hypothetical protein